MTTSLDADVYVAPIRVDEIFADHTYQRVLDVPRARKMAATWDRRLAGILEVSDRGQDVTPRYAIMDGQHRWAAAGFLVDPPLLVANVHEGLTVAQEAQLFDKLNRQRRQPSTWDHWKARRAAGEEQVLAIEEVVRRNNLQVALSPSDGRISCVASLEKIAKVGGTELVNESISLIVEIWGPRRDALDAPIIHGLALVLHYLAEPLDLVRLGNTLVEIMPRQLRSQAAALKEISHGSLPVLTALAIMSLYNRKPGRKLDVSHKTFGGTGVNNAAGDRDKPVQRRGGARTSPQQHEAIAKLEQIGDPANARRRTVPDAMPHYADTEEHTEAVAKMEGKTVAEIAETLGIAARTVRRIQADLGIEVSA